MHDDVINPDELAIVIDGVEPGDIDAVASMTYIDAMFRLIRACSADGDLRLVGLRIKNKCAAFCSTPVSLTAAKLASARAVEALLAGGGPGLDTLVGHVRKAQAKLPEAYVPTLMVGDYIAPRLRVAPEPSEWNYSIETLRVVPFRAGGKEPVVWFTGILDHDEFSLRVSEAQAREFGELLYREVEIDAEIERDDHWRIRGGSINQLTLVTEGDDLSAWKAWFRQYQAAWMEVDDVEAELGRN